MHYHVIIYAVGAQTDRRMNIPGEDLPGSYAATEFVGWYNGHPDYCGMEFDLSQERVAVVGNGNVAMDVARILTRTREELMETDIADCAIDALIHSHVKEIYILGRRGPIQAKFTPPELKELGEMADADGRSSLPTKSSLNRSAARICWRPMIAPPSKITRCSGSTPKMGICPDHARSFCASWYPRSRSSGSGASKRSRLVKNELYRRDDGSLRPRPTDQYETIPVGLVFRSIGYQGVPLPGVPFDASRNVIPNIAGARRAARPAST